MKKWHAKAGFILSLIACLYCITGLIQSMWLSATPDYSIERANRNVLVFGCGTLVSCILAVVFLTKIYRFSRSNRRGRDKEFDLLKGEVPSQGSLSYTHDDASRLTSMTVAGQPTVNYTYDNADRRTSLTLPNGVMTEYIYDNDSRLTGINYKKGGSTLGDLTYTYDESGRRTKMGGSFARTDLPQTITTTSYNVANHQTSEGSYW